MTVKEQFQLLKSTLGLSDLEELQSWNTKEKSLRGKAKKNKMFSDSKVGNFPALDKILRTVKHLLKYW